MCGIYLTTLDSKSAPWIPTYVGLAQENFSSMAMPICMHTCLPAKVHCEIEDRHTRLADLIRLNLCQKFVLLHKVTHLCRGEGGRDAINIVMEISAQSIPLCREFHLGPD